VTNKTAATRYARALFDVAVKEKADLEQIEREIGEFAGLFTAYPQLERVLLNPAVPVQRKRAAVVDVLDRTKFQPVLTKLLTMLAERDRLVLVPDVRTAFSERVMDYRNVVRAEVTTAAPIDPKRTEAIRSGLAKLTGRTVNLDARVDPAIIGGVVARIGSTVYDGSVTRQLEKMKERLVESV
jgi:F-type H+-transporting ATPase subunit delta